MSLSLSLSLSADITEMGRTSRVYSELASRTEPTVSDVHMALVDAGIMMYMINSYRTS